MAENGNMKNLSHHHRHNHSGFFGGFGNIFIVVFAGFGFGGFDGDRHRFFHRFSGSTFSKNRHQKPDFWNCDFLYHCALVLAGMFYLFAPLLITEIYNFSTFISAYIPNISFLNYFQNEAFSGAKDIVSALSGQFFHQHSLGSVQSFRLESFRRIFPSSFRRFRQYFQFCFDYSCFFLSFHRRKRNRKFFAHYCSNSIRRLCCGFMESFQPKNRLVGERANAFGFCGCRFDLFNSLAFGH